MREPMARSMMFSSSLLVIMITGMWGCCCLMDCRVCRPVMPGMCSSRITISNSADSIASSASDPEHTVVSS